MRPYELAEDQAREQDRAEMFARAEAFIRDQIADEQAEEMSRGERCVDCGTEFIVALHRPSRCITCGGEGETSMFYAGDRYLADSNTATIARKHEHQRRVRYAQRVTRVLARQGGAQ